MDEDNSARRAAPDHVWEAVRADYLGGVSAAECSRRHGVGLTTLRTRAAQGGWRRADQPWSPPRLDPSVYPDDEGLFLEMGAESDLDGIEPRDLVLAADRRMIRAVLKGDASAALRWARVRRIMEQERDDMDRWMAEDEVQSELSRMLAERAADALKAEVDPDDP